MIIRQTLEDEAEVFWLLCGFLFPQLRRAGLSLISQPSWYSTGQRAKESNTNTRPLTYLDGQSIGSRSRNIAFFKSCTCMWLARSLQARSLRTKSYLDLQPYFSKAAIRSR